MKVKYVIHASKEYFPFKVAHIRLMVRVQRRSNFSFMQPAFLSACTCPSFRKYPSNVFKFIYGIQVYYGMLRIENVYIRLMVHIQAHTKETRDIKSFYHVYDTLSTMKLT